MRHFDRNARLPLSSRSQTPTAEMDLGFQPRPTTQCHGEVSPSPGPGPIPLICYICPKNTNFSDLSHLLTHISSKGHLHNMFQLTLSQEVDKDAEETVSKFNTWYKNNNISLLLRARKSAREQRDSNQRQTPAVSNSNGRGGTAAASRQNIRGSRPNRRGRGNGRTETQSRAEATSIIDDDDIIKFESDETDVQATQNTIHTPYAWHSHTSYPNHSAHYPSSFGTQFQDYLEDEDDSTKYEPSEIFSPYLDEDTPEAAEDDTGALILKGYVYPGMGGFDAATEKDRRMRNQKKDPAVLLKLEANSERVTRAEEVLDINLEYQRSRDVYDEPSVDGSEDENGIALIEGRNKRKPKAKPTYTATKQRRSNTRSRAQAQPTSRTRSLRSSNRHTRVPSPAVTQSVIPNRRITRSFTNKQENMPLHNHGAYPDMGPVRVCEGELDNDEDFRRTHIHTPIAGSMRQQQHDHLPGLVLRPGNPNATFASSTSSFKKSPPRYSGKENNHLVIKSPPSFNPYLHPSAEPIQSNNYNPLCPQPRDGFGYRIYSSYDEESKSSVSSGFNPINTGSTYDPAHIPGMTSNPYHQNQPSGDDYIL